MSVPATDQDKALHLGIALAVAVGIGRGGHVKRESRDDVRTLREEDEGCKE